MAINKGKSKKNRANKSAGKDKNTAEKNLLKKKIKFGIKLVIAGTLLVCLFVILKYGSKALEYKKYAAQLVADENVFKSSLTTLVYDSKGENIINLSAEKDSFYLESDEIPYIVKRTFVTSEDR